MIYEIFHAKSIVHIRPLIMQFSEWGKILLNQNKEMFRQPSRLMIENLNNSVGCSTGFCYKIHQEHMQLLSLQREQRCSSLLVCIQVISLLLTALQRNWHFQHTTKKIQRVITAYTSSKGNGLCDCVCVLQSSLCSLKQYQCGGNRHILTCLTFEDKSWDVMFCHLETRLGNTGYWFLRQEGEPHPLHIPKQ